MTDIVKEIVHFMAPDVQIKKLADRLESGDVPPIGEMVAELRDIARRMAFLESCLQRHVVEPLTVTGAGGTKVG